jgi:hypothetical protein
MTPKEKAIELFKKYYCLENNSKKRIKVIEFDTAKQCALIAIDEMLESHYKLLSGVNTTTYKYWEEVKQEILAL